MSESRIYEYVMFLQEGAVMVRPDPMLIAPIRDANDIVVLPNGNCWRRRSNLHDGRGFLHSPASAFLQSVNILVYTGAELMRRLRS
jgi:hypothetical protein